MIRIRGLEHWNGSHLPLENMHSEFLLLKWESFASGKVACIVCNSSESKNQGHLPLALGPYASFFQKQNKKFRIEAEGIKFAKISSKPRIEAIPIHSSLIYRSSCTSRLVVKVDPVVSFQHGLAMPVEFLVLSCHSCLKSCPSNFASVQTGFTSVLVKHTHT